MFQLKSWYLGREKKKVTLEILNMFDAGVLAQIEGADIDQPFNAMTLKPTRNGLFGSFEVFSSPFQASKIPISSRP